MDESCATAQTPVWPSSDFEALLLELFSEFVDVPGEEVDRKIRTSQRRLCDALGLDRTSLWQIDPQDPTNLFVTHVYDRQSVTDPIDEQTGSLDTSDGRVFLLGHGVPYPAAVGSAVRLPWHTRRLLAGLTTVTTRVEDLPPEAATDAQSLRMNGTMSNVCVPLVTDVGVLGCVTFAATQQPRTWPAPLVKRLELLAQVFGRALARKRAERRLRESEERLSLAAAAAGAGLWEVDLATGHVQATEVAKNLFGLNPGEEVTIPRIQSVVHPDDRPAYDDRVRRLLNNVENFSAEYRVVLADGTIRWISSRGTSFAPESGRTGNLVVGASVDVTERRRAEEQLRAAMEDLKHLKEQLQHENVYLQQEIRERRNPSQIVGTSAAIRRALDLAQQVAATSSTVLLFGETGTGKERVAAAIHDLSPRRARPMVKVNCAAMPATLIESELFGREKGAYTGALTRQIGRFEVANGSTIFLDEIGDLPIETQAKLLRVIETRDFERLGSPNPIHVDVRIIAATNRDLEEAVRAGRFREDLFFRLNVFPITMPPLRERPEDIPLLVKALVEELSATMGRQFDSVPRAGIEALQRYHWPGNVRELRNVIERAMITSDGPLLHLEPPGSWVRRPGTSSAQSLRAIERDHILAVLQQTGWRVRGPRGAAAILGLPPTTLENRMAKLGLVRPGKNLP